MANIWWLNYFCKLQGTPFFNGKLILHDPPGLNTNGASRGTSRPTGCNLLAMQSNGSGSCYPGAGGGFTLTSPPSKLGAIPKKMPSKAAQVSFPNYSTMFVLPQKVSFFTAR